MNATGRSQELRRAVAKKEGARDHERERSWSKEKLKRRKKNWIEPFLSHLTKGSTTTGLCPIPCLCSEWTPCSGSKAPPSPFDCASVSPCRSPSHSSSRAGNVVSDKKCAGAEGEKKVMFGQSRPGRVKQRFWRFFVHISTSGAKLKNL